MRKHAALRQSDVLSVLQKHDKPMTAYEILGQMKTDEPDLAAPTIYRALAALTDQGRAHRLESMNSFVPCRCEHADSLPVLAVCEDCGAVEEQDGSPLLSGLREISSRIGFAGARHIIEIQGQCRDCA